MPVPKRKTSKSRRDMRQSCKFIRAQQFGQCQNCTEFVGSHQACNNCGFYKGKQVIKSKLARTAQRALDREAQAAQAQAGEAQ